jgi:hypothetical protein
MSKLKVNNLQEHVLGLLGTFRYSENFTFNLEHGKIDSVVVGIYYYAYL